MKTFLEKYVGQYVQLVVEEPGTLRIQQNDNRDSWGEIKQCIAAKILSVTDTEVIVEMTDDRVVKGKVIQKVHVISYIPLTRIITAHYVTIQSTPVEDEKNIPIPV